MAEERFTRVRYVTYVSAICCLAFVANGVFDYYWLGMMSALSLAIAVIWALVGIVNWFQPYAVLRDEDLILWEPPIRPRRLPWRSIRAARRTSHGGLQLELSNGHKLTVHPAAVPRSQRQGLMDSIERRVGRQTMSAEPDLDHGG